MALIVYRTNNCSHFLILYAIEVYFLLFFDKQQRFILCIEKKSIHILCHNSTRSTIFHSNFLDNNLHNQEHFQWRILFLFIKYNWVHTNNVSMGAWTGTSACQVPTCKGVKARPVLAHVGPLKNRPAQLAKQKQTQNIHRPVLRVSWRADGLVRQNNNKIIKNKNNYLIFFKK